MKRSLHHLYAILLVTCSLLLAPTALAQNGSLDFDGTNDYVDVPHDASLDLTSAVTVEAWVRMDVTNTYIQLVGKADESTAGYGLGITNQQVIGVIWDESSNPVSVFGGVVSTGVWAHVAFTWEQGGTMKAYLNGSEVASTAAGASTIGTTANDLGIGSWEGLANFANGRIDDVRIWSVARTQAQIADNRFASLTGHEAGLVAYFPLNEGMGTTTTDRVDGRTGTLTNMAATAWTDGPPLAAPATFSASDGTYIDRVHLTWADGGQETGYNIYSDDTRTTLVATVGADVTSYDVEPGPTTPTTYCVVPLSDTVEFDQACDAGFRGEVQASDDTLEDRIDVTWPTLAEPPLWIKITRDGTLINLLPGATPSFSDATATPGTTYTYCVILSDGTTDGDPFCDTGRRILFAPTGFTASKATYDTGVELHWSDRSGIESGYWLTRTGGQSIVFDGINDTGTTVNSIDLTTAFTLSLYAKRTRTGTAETILSHGTNAAAAGLALGFDASDRFRFLVVGHPLTTTETFTDTDWHHFAVTYDPTTRARAIYADGVLVAMDVLPTAYTGTGPLVFGQLAWGGEFWAGGLDEVRRWTVVRKANGIVEDVTSFPRGVELHAYWPFDLTSGSVAREAIGRNDLLLENITDAAWQPPSLALLARNVRHSSRYVDRATEPLTVYTYTVAAFVDHNDNSTYDVGVDDISASKQAQGWRSLINPPSDVSATDGQYLDRVVVSMVNRAVDVVRLNIYREGSLLGTIEGPLTAGDEYSYTDNTVTPNVTYAYCAEAETSEGESAQRCDSGRAGGLAPPIDVAASDETFDAHVQVTWADTTSTESGFEILRDGSLLATVGADVDVYNDTSAQQDVTYSYCVRALSTADPDAPSYSTQLCESGTRAAVLAPRNVAVSEGTYEDRAEVTWTHTSATAMLFNIYRDGVLIGAVAPDQPLFGDLTVDSDTPHTYCVEGVTVLNPPAALRAEVRRFVEGRAMGHSTQANPNEVAGTMKTALQRLVRMQGGSASTIAYSDQVCADGYRSINPPSAVAATYDEFEDHVQVSWANSSSVATGFEVYRSNELRLDGTDDYVAFPEGTFSLTDITLEAWIYWNGGAIWQRVFDFGQGTNAYLFFTPQSTTGSARFAIKPPSAPEQVLDAPVVLPEGVWTHVALVIGGTTGTLYFDGVEQVSGTITANPVDVVGDNLWLGRSQFGSDPYFDGSLRDVRLWRQARTATQIAERRFDTLAGTEPGLVGFWPMDDAGGHLAKDRSLASNDGVLKGGASVGERIATVAATRTSFGDYEGTPGEAYRYGVRATDAYGASASGEDEGFRALKAPTALRATDGTSETFVELTWQDNSAAEDGYRVYRRTPSATDSTLLATLPAKSTSYLDDAVPAVNQVYAYSIEAFDAYGTSASATDEGTTAIQAPGSVQASDTYDGLVVVTWVDRSNLETGHEIYRDGVLLSTVNPNITTYTDATVNEGSTYTYCVNTLQTTNGTVRSAQVCDTGGSPAPVVADDVLDVQTTSDNRFLGDDPGDLFGISVAMDDGFAAAGAPFGDPPVVVVANQGLIRFFRRNGGTWNVTTTQGNPANWNHNDIDADRKRDRFGSSVALHGDLAVTGAPGDIIEGSTDEGSSAILRRDKVSGLWEMQTVIKSQEPTDIGSTPTDEHRVGFSTAITNSWALAGAPGQDLSFLQHVGVGHISKNNGDGTWGTMSNCIEGGEEPKCRYASYTLGASDRVRSDAEPLLSVGASAALTENFALLGDHEDSKTNGLSGAVYLYERSGDEWGSRCFTYDPNRIKLCLETQKLVRSFGPVPYGLGSALALTDEFAVVATQHNDGLSIYERNPITERWGTNCNEETNPDPLDNIDNTTVSCEPTTGITLPNGCIEEHGLDDSRFSLPTLALDGNQLLVGCPAADDVASNAGAALLFERIGGTWQQTLKITPHDGEADDSFGASVAIDDNQFLIGAPYHDGNGADAGAIYFVPRLLPPSNVVATDGTLADRVRVTWDDEAVNETSYRIYRDDTAEPIAEVPANTTVFSDQEAEPGAAYTYCVTAAIGDEEVDPVCDFGRRAPNGSITGRVATEVGAGVEGASVCLTPNQNRSLLFDGLGGYMETGLTDLSGDAITIEYWFRGDRLQSAVRQQSGIGGEWVVAGWSGNEFPPYTHILSNHDGTNGIRVSTTQGEVVDGAWHHVAMTWERDQPWGFKSYLDGVPQDSASTVGKEPIPNIASPLLLGSRSGEAEFTDGQLDEVRVWSIARTRAEIQASMFTPLEGDEPGLIGYWPLDQFDGTVAPDLTASNYYGTLIDGVYFADEGADPVQACALTDGEGNFKLEQIRYGSSETSATTFEVRPSLGQRRFRPAVQEISLSKDSPTWNNVVFSDVTSFTIQGTITFDGTSCPVPDAEIYVDDVLEGTTGADGTFRVAVDPSTGASDLRQIVPRLDNPANPEDTPHVFTPTNRTLRVVSDTTGINFSDRKRRTFAGFFGGSCGTEIGTATLRITTENGCFTQDVPLSDGTFSVELPPQAYLVEVIDVATTNSDLRADILAFFDGYGTREIDLTQADTTLNFIYRAPLQVTVEGLPQTNLCNTLTQNDEDGNLLRTLPVVPLLTQSTTYPLTLSVNENYGNGVLCPVDSGQVTIYDNISDQEGDPVVLEIKDGIVHYETTALSPNVFGGARVDGVDRSYQKYLTTIAEVEGRPVVEQTDWVLVEGLRPRTATFVTAPSNPIPMWIVHDPPGDNSYSFIEAGSTICKSMSHEETIAFNTDAKIETKVGVEFWKGVAFGGFFATKTEAVQGITVDINVGFGGAFERGYTVCMTFEERFATSSSPLFVGPNADVFVGLGLNYLFAQADDLDVDISGGQCEVNLEEVLAMGLDLDDPIRTTYNYTRGFIEDTLIPQLDELAEQSEAGSDAQLEARDARQTWTHVLGYDESLREAFEVETNHSFASGADVSRTKSYSEDSYSTNAATEAFSIGKNFSALFGETGNQIRVSGADKFTFTGKQVFKNTDGGTFKTGYVLADDDLGDYFSVDVGHAECLVDGETRTCNVDGHEKPPFAPGAELLFAVRSGRTSGPWEPGPDANNPVTQPRDRAQLTINPPERHNVPPGDPATFTMTLTNASESQEAREYMLRTIHTSNPGGAVLSAQGAGIQGGLAFFLDGDPSRASQEVTLSVKRGPTRYQYEDLEVMLYPPGEYSIWSNGGALQLADTVSFSVYYDAPCSDVALLRPHPFWQLNAATLAGGLDVILHQFTLTPSETDVVTRIGLEYRPQRTSDWQTAVSALISSLTFADPDNPTWTTSWLPPSEGVYDVRAFTECAAAGPGARVYSDVLPGTFDATAPRVFGTPSPADQVLSLGDDIAFTFDEPVACPSVNAQLTYVDGPDAGQTIPNLDVLCDGRRVMLMPPASYDWSQAENRRLEARITGGGSGLTDPASNPLADDAVWTFAVYRSNVAWSPGSVAAAHNRFTSAALTAALANGRADAASFTLSDVPTWLTPSATTGNLPPGGQASITFAIDPSLDVGVHEDTVQAAVTVGSETLDALLFVQVEVLNLPQQTRQLAQGWSWISLNRTPTSTHPDSVLASLRAQGGDLVKGQAAFSLFDYSSGSWVGALSELAPGHAYQVKLGQAGTLNVEGPAVSPTTPIAVTAGWNWIGYLPQEILAIDDALASLDATATSGDLIKSQTQFATYNGTDWVGSLTHLAPGQGYLLSSASAGTLTYPAPSATASDAPDVLAALRAAATRDAFAAAEKGPEPDGKVIAHTPDGTEPEERELAAHNLVPQAYAHSMTLIGTVTLDDLPLDDDATRVWLTDEDGTVRGSATLRYIEALQAHRLFLMFYSDMPHGEAFAVHVEHPSLDEPVTLDQRLNFKADHRAGTLDEPVLIAAETEAYKAAKAAAEIPETYALDQNYPNPFNPTTAIRYGLPEAGEVRLIVYDVLGREVLRLVDGQQPAGWHTVTFDGRILASGTYLYRLEAGAFKQVQTMILMK